MTEEYIVKQCECGEAVKVPKDTPNDLLNWRPAFCPNCDKQHTYDYDKEIWLK